MSDSAILFWQFSHTKPQAQSLHNALRPQVDLKFTTFTEAEENEILTNILKSRFNFDHSLNDTNPINPPLRDQTLKKIHVTKIDIDQFMCRAILQPLNYTLGIITSNSVKSKCYGHVDD